MVIQTQSQRLTDDEVDRIFHALADATRRDIIQRTLTREQSLTELAADYDMSFAAVHKHVSVLEGAGLITKHANGRARLVQANPSMLRKVRGLLDEYEQIWRGRIERLDALLAED
ncbi:metalloregulator ArsR/SmtB family transcription factor [Rarobacter faecitabidus]|uniref:ArsR family transcriptional regulator n=1 Tax=Rarobacter faecitabidus TaxID=13243 RepID=A0A542ZWK8_RARFA|nr:helix-turn-helix domain-containing protein [Rarobacter faecitabidus]TQL64754.1 ArsR family transcriptional regulator [Rarobacter faecitabidus]